MSGRRRSILALFLCATALVPAASASASETLTYNYDARGRLVKVARSGTVNNGVNACYSYDGAGNRTYVTVAAGPCSPVSLPPNFAISDASATEGGMLTFTINRVGSAAGTTSVSYATASGSAVSPSDYASTSGTLTFAAGDVSKTVTVTTVDDSIYEGAEAFTVNLSGATGGAIITDNQAIGTINDNDAAPPPPGFAINDVSVTEGGTLVFTVTKTGSTSASFSVNFAAANGTASATDYTVSSGTLTFAAAEMTKTITIVTADDATAESNETVLVNLSGASGGASISDGQGVGTIIDNEVSFRIDDVEVVEGSPAVFTVTKVGSNGGTVSVNYATSPGSAGTGDFTSTSGTLTFGPTQSIGLITVNTNSADVRYEPDEIFTVNLSGATGGATISDAGAIATIYDYWGSQAQAPGDEPPGELDGAPQAGPEAFPSDLAADAPAPSTTSGDGSAAPEGRQ